MLNANIDIEKTIVPDCDYPLPPYHFIGQGITLIYEIPYSRIKGAIPSVFEPDPGKRKIWFMVNFYNWQKFFPLSNPDDQHTFCEAYYKFSVKYQSKLGDYPIKLYLTSAPGIASGIELYGYPKYPADMNFDMKKKKGLFSIQRNGRSELEIELTKAEGISAKVTSFFANLTARSYLEKYVGNFLYNNDSGKEKLVCGPTRINTIQYNLAKIIKIYLREPLEWNILRESEIQKPKYSFILTDITADLDPPVTIFPLN